MFKALAILAVLATATHSAVVPATLPAVEHMHAVTTSNPTSILSDPATRKQPIITDEGICNEYYTHLLLLEEFEGLAAEREVDGKKTLDKASAKALKKVVKSMKKKTKIRDESGKKVDHMCWAKSSVKAFYESILTEFDPVGTVPDLTEAERNLLKRTPGGASSRVALSNTAEKIAPCSQFASCPYADCYSCFYGWYLGGSSKTEFEYVALYYTYNETYYASINTPLPFPHSPVEFRDQECKVTHFKYHAFPEPSNLISSDPGMSCTEAMTCDNWITSYNYENNLYDNYQDATHCLCSYTPYSGKSATVNNVATAFSSVCKSSLVMWHGYNTANF